MNQKPEKTLFFIKPYIELEKAVEIRVKAHELLRDRIKVDFKILESFLTSLLEKEFWIEFYAPVGITYPKVPEIIGSDFGSCFYGVDGEVLEGNGIILALREVVGSRHLKENPPWTIRGMYGHYNNDSGLEHRTVVHASTPDQVERDFEIFRKRGIIT